MSDDQPSTKRQKSVDLISWAEADCQPESAIEALSQSADTQAQTVFWLVQKHVMSTEKDLEHRNRALRFVTKWLSIHPENVPSCTKTKLQHGTIEINLRRSAVPSLQQLCAQTVAAILFPEALRETVRHDGMYSIHGLVSSHLAKSRTVDFMFINRRVCEELFIFLIIYFLLEDLRNLEGYPSLPDDDGYIRSLALPLKYSGFEKETDDYDDDEEEKDIDDDYMDWWDNEGKWEVLAAIPCTGRGALARNTLAIYSLLLNFNNSITDDGKFEEYGRKYHEFLSVLVDNYLDTHPLTLSFSVTAIEALSIGFTDYREYAGCGEDEDVYDFIKESLLPFMERKHNEMYGACPHDEYTELLGIMKGDRIAISEIREITARPLQPPSQPKLCLQRIISRLRQYTGAASEPYCANQYGDCLTECVRLRLSGQHSKLFLLRCACASPCTKVLDLQGCTNLDEDCLNAMLNHCSKVNVVFLKGTSIPENSSVLEAIRKDRKRKVLFDFSGKRCRCCGHSVIL